MKFTIPLTLILLFSLAATAAAQWLETTIYLPDMRSPHCLTYNSTNNTVYVGGGNCIVAIDGVTNKILY